MPESTTPADAFPAVVIGGGLAGLTAAVHLAERGISPLVLEADREFAGGRLSGGPMERFEHTGRQWAFPSEHGVHAVWGGYDNTRAMLAHFLTVTLRESEREEWINRDGRRVWVAEAGSAVRRTWLPAPFHYLQLLLRPRFWPTITIADIFSLPGFLVSILLTIGVDPIAEQMPLDHLRMKDYFFGWATTLRATLAGVGRNMLAASEDEITLGAFIAALRTYTMLRRDSWRLAYFPGNPQTLVVGPLCEKIEQDGGQVTLGARATRLERQGEGWRVAFEDSRRGGTRSLLARRVILAADAPSARSLLAASPDTKEEAERLIFPEGLASAVVRLWFDRAPRPSAAGGMFTGDFLPDNFFWLERIHEEFREWGEAGFSAAEMHIYGMEEELRQPDTILLAQAGADLQRAYPELRGRIVHAAVRRNERTQARFRVPTAESLHVVTPWDRIYACGDWVGYPTPSLNIERAVITGIAAANAVIAEEGLEPFPILPPPRPEGLVRVLGVGIGGLRRVIGPPMMALARRRRAMKSEK